MRQFTAILIIVFAAGAAWGLESPVGSQIGSPTQVPSAGRSGLIPSRPDTAGTYSNQIVTGNVGGGRHFRGVVPYSSYLYSDPGFASSRDSVAVSNFIRRSAGYEPFFDPRRTATKVIQEGESGVQSPMITGQAAAASNPSQAWLDSFDLTRVITPPRQAMPLVEPEVNRRLLEEGRDEILDDTVVVDPLRRYFPEELQEGEEVEEDSLTVPRPEEEAEREAEAPDLYEEIRQNLLKEQEEAEAEERAVPEEEAEETGEEALARAQAPQLRREYGTYGNLARVRYGEYMDLGQKLIREGQYYKAADAFELANVWDPESNLARLARSHALFGAGEYMSSAYYLHEALSREPALARARIKMDELVGGRDLYESRLSELTKWQMRSQSGEMAFLVSYLMFMDSKTQRASDLLEQAAHKMPDSIAVAALKKAIADPQHVIEVRKEAAP